MNVLVINAGSSSLKYQLIKVETQELLAKGLCERVGSNEAVHKHGLSGNEHTENVPLPDHDCAVALVLEALTSGPTKAIDSLEEIDAVGHRIVQGGKYFDRSVIIDEDGLVVVFEDVLQCLLVILWGVRLKQFVSYTAMDGIGLIE